MKQKGIALAIGLAMLCSGWLTACSGQSNGTDATAAAESPSAEYGAMDTVGGAMPQAANEESAVETDAGAGGLDTAARPTDGEKLIENLYYEIETLQFDDSVEQIRLVYRSLGGYVQELASRPFQGTCALRTILRIPQKRRPSSEAPQAQECPADNSSVQNVADEYYDIEARLKSLRTQEERLLALLEQSGSWRCVQLTSAFRCDL
ncbi:MAG: DUF4349 domain-containing protein [[Clostridium] leptum]